MHYSLALKCLAYESLQLVQNSGFNIQNIIILSKFSIRKKSKLRPAGKIVKQYLNIAFILKVSLHEVGHNFGLTDHAAYQPAANGLLCPMSREGFNKFGYRGYVKVIVDGRGKSFCDECINFMKSVYGHQTSSQQFQKDGVVPSAH